VEAALWRPVAEGGCTRSYGKITASGGEGRMAGRASVAHRPSPSAGKNTLRWKLCREGKENGDDKGARGSTLIAARTGGAQGEGTCVGASGTARQEQAVARGNGTLAWRSRQSSG
jgi:hypothetical protein